MERPPASVTQLLQQLHGGDDAALERLMPLLYDELRQLARNQLRRERAGHTLNPTALVNEVYLKLAQQEQLLVANRAHFFGIAATMMRRVLVDYARARKRVKRGGDQVAVPFEEAELFLSDREADEVLALDEALDRLAQIEPRAAEVVQLRFYSGLTIEETAEVLGLSARTVKRSWKTARLWLRKEVLRDLPD